MDISLHEIHAEKGKVALGKKLKQLSAQRINGVVSGSIHKGSTGTCRR